MNQNIDNSWAHSAHLDENTRALLGNVPGRWGRMTPLSRLVVVEVGKLLKTRQVISATNSCVEQGLAIGLIGGTGRGSLYTDCAFSETMQEGPGLASPALFGYTLPNIPLAEAASHYGLVGPVYAVFAEESPLQVAVDEAEMLLTVQKELTLMIACEFDHYSLGDGPDKLDVNLTLIERDA